MVELAEVVRENIGKSCYQMTEFFQSMIDKKELNAYLVEIDKKIIEKDTEEEQVIRIKKGATLTPTTELGIEPGVLLEDPATKTFYNLNIGVDGYSSFTHDFCVLEKLPSPFDSKCIPDVKERYCCGIRRLYFPDDMLAAKLRMEWYGTREQREHSLVVEGEQDKLFEKVCEFVRQ